MLSCVGLPILYIKENSHRNMGFFHYQKYWVFLLKICSHGNMNCMKLTYWLFTPRETKEFLNPINWGLLQEIFLEYVEQISPNIELSFPQSINIWWLKSVVANLMSKGQDEMIWWTYSLSSKNIQINTTTKIKEYVLLLAIIHEVTHALWFNDHRNKSGYSIWRKFNKFNEWVTQKITEEVADKFLMKTDLADKRSIYLKQVARNLAIMIMGSADLLEKTKQSIPSIWRIMESNSKSKEVSMLMAKELLNDPKMRAAIEEKSEENLTETIVYVIEVGTVNKLISVFSIHSWKSEQEIWTLIKRWYFEGIDIIELCTSSKYWINFNESELINLMDDSVSVL